MKCSCCGREVSPNDRYCSYCGQNNEGYVEPEVVVTDRNVPTNSQTSNYSQPGQQSYPTFTQINITQQKPVQPESITLSVFALIFGLLGGWLGLILGIVGLTHYKESGNRTRCGIAIGAWIFWLIVYILLASL